MSKSYEHLAGAAGRARFFRPKRYGAGELFAGAPPRVWFEEKEFSLANISATGVGCRTRDFDLPENEAGGDTSGVLRLTQRGREIFRAKARLARADIARGALFVGLALDGANFELDDLVRKNAGALADALANSTNFETGARAEPSAEYKCFCADVLDFVGRHLDNIETHFAPIEQKLDNRAKDEIIAELANGAAREWRAMLEQGNDLVLPIHRDKAQRVVLKKFTERVVTRELTGGESWARSYYKPMGYPGDYRIMNFMYDGDPRGDDLRAKFLHMLGVIAGQPIVTRMEKLAEIMNDHARRQCRSGETINITSVGSGPARELEMLARGENAPHWRATLIDQEDEALDYAINRALAMQGHENIDVSALNISFKEMLAPEILDKDLPRQDIIYSSGLVDYLNPLLAMRFIARIYEHLKPGGTVIIGNVNDLRSGTLWPMEYVLDWTLYFRNAKEMLALADGATGATVTLERDALNAIYFLVLEKPAD